MNEYINGFLDILRNHYADFSGRARRKEYWGFALINVIVGFVLGILNGIFAGNSESGLSIFSLINVLYTLVVFVPGTAVTARRLHDTGRSGWMQLLAFIPLVGWFIVLYFLIQDSQPQANKWGPNPKAPQRVGAVSAARADW